jgi:phosphate-selective porin OprO/OprP
MIDIMSPGSDGLEAGEEKATQDSGSQSGKEVTTMKPMAEQGDARDLHRRLPIPSLVTWRALLSPLGVLLPIAVVLFLLVTSPNSTRAESEAQAHPAPGQKDDVLEELVRRFQLLEERLRQNERERDVLIAEMQHLKTDLMKLESDATPLSDAGLAAGSSTTSAEGQRQSTSPDETPAEEIPLPDVSENADRHGGVNAGWDGGFYIRSSDGRFEFRPLGILHADFRAHEDEREINTGDTIATTFDIRRLRLGFEGFLFRDIDYSFEVNIDEDEAELIYAYADFGQIPWLHVRLGQFKEPFSYEVLYPEKYLDFVERAYIVTAVGPAEDIGGMVHNFGHPYAGIFEYAVGVFNGEGIHLNDEENDDVEVAARLALLPFAGGPTWLQKLKIAGNMTYTGEQERDFGFRPRTSEGFEFFPRLPVEGERIRMGGDLQWFYGPFSLKAEYIRAEEERPGGLPDLITQGWHVDATWLITGEEKKRSMASGWELAARYDEIRVDAQEPFLVPGFANSVEDNRVRSVTVGLNKYLIYNIKFQLNYQHDWFDNRFLTPTSRRRSGVLGSGDRSLSKLLARLQLFF